MSFDHLRIQPGQSVVPTLEKHNGVADALLRARIIGLSETVSDPQPFPHPFKVTTRRFEPPEGTTALLDPEKTWRVDVAPGTINDELPGILYARQNDPRGWGLPEGYVEPTPPAKRDARWIDRDVLDDPEDPPFLVARETEDFVEISDAQRPDVENGAFCGELDWEKELWRAHVILSATPLKAGYFNATLPPPRLAKYRLYVTPRKPVRTMATAGGWLELATLYLLRDRTTPDPATSVLLPRMRNWWTLWGLVVQPGKPLADLFELMARDAPAGFADLYRPQFEGDLEEAATVEFWNV